ncbi:MAG: KH domain-containing protein [Chloroflexi bacterium]|nr:KH domain-containing protein [Chloroflexota bacterium]
MREDQRQPENDEIVDEVVQDEPVDEIVTEEIRAEAPADDEYDAEDESESYEDIGEIEGETEMRDMIGYIARALVDEPDAVEVRSQWSDGRLNINLKVADADKGKVIGRRGRVVHAMQSLLRVAATKSNMRAGIDVE